tara:strand:+ start:62 stop:448 length:387 start_codon:yes stop_codon:yes gene_type:complete
MGASSSIVDSILYLSYGEKSHSINIIINKLTEMGFAFCNRELEMISTAQYIIICIDKNITRNYKQICEMNKCEDLNKEIIYLMMDDMYNHDTNPELNRLFPINRSIMSFEKNCLDNTVNDINLLLSSL